MLTGRRAFPGSDSRQILHQLMDEYPPPVSRLVPGLPEAVDQAIYQAIAKNREDRFSSCIDFQQALESAVRDTTPIARPEPPLTDLVPRRGHGSDRAAQRAAEPRSTVTG